MSIIYGVRFDMIWYGKFDNQYFVIYNDSYINLDSFIPVVQIEIL